MNLQTLILISLLVQLRNHKRAVGKRKYENWKVKSPAKYKAWRIRRRDVQRPYALAYLKSRRLRDRSFSIGEALRKYVREALQRTHTRSKFQRLVGCSMAEARKHLESQFTAGMSWDNYGRNGWEIDHIKPVSSYDLTQTEQAKLCFHFSNMQPLWPSDNVKKSNKLIYG